MFEIIVSVALLVGVFFILVGSIGLLRLPDFFSRLHAPTKASTLGVGCVLLASLLSFAARGELHLQGLLVIVLLFVSAPVSAYMLARAGATESDAQRGDGVEVKR